MGKTVARAFLAGGIMGMITQLLMTVWTLVLGGDSMFVGPLSLVCLGLITLATYPSGLFNKVQDWGGWGIMLTFSGLAGAVADCFRAVKGQSGSAGKAVLEAFKLVFGIVSVGAIAFIVVDLLMVFCGIDFGIAAMLATVTPAIPIYLAFVLAFVFGGILAAIFQIAAMLSNSRPPTLLKIGFAIGGLCVPLGFLDWLEAIGGGGIAAMVVDAGGALSGTFIALLTTGFPIPIIIVLGVFVALVLIGCITGAISKPISAEEN